MLVAEDTVIGQKTFSHPNTACIAAFQKLKGRRFIHSFSERGVSFVKKAGKSMPAVPNREHRRKKKMTSFNVSRRQIIKSFVVMSVGAGLSLVGTGNAFGKSNMRSVTENSGSLLFVNVDTGEGATAKLDSAGNYHYVGALSGFGKWTHIIGAASGGVLFVNVDTREGATARLDSAGYYQYVGALSSFGKWTHIVGR
jgi:hypothetical protein